MAMNNVRDARGDYSPCRAGTEIRGDGRGVFRAQRRQKAGKE
jgi:hypothetical protein